jgi:hypothetical protein
MPVAAPSALNPPATLQISDWETAAKRLLRSEMTRRQWRYQRLSLELKLKLGIEESTAQLTRKVSRGKFSAGFLLACLEVLGVEAVRMADVRASMPKADKTGVATAKTGKS